MPEPGRTRLAKRNLNPVQGHAFWLLGLLDARSSLGRPNCKPQAPSLKRWTGELVFEVFLIVLDGVQGGTLIVSQSVGLSNSSPVLNFEDEQGRAPD